MANLVTVKLNKPQGASWGFRLQGGKDFATPLCIQKVNMSSVAEKAGLAAGDAIVSIAGKDAHALRHKEAQDIIVYAGNSFDLVIQRGMNTWKPLVAPLSEPKSTPQGMVITNTSLAATPQKIRNIGSGYNTSATPFLEGPDSKHLVNSQFNTPINLYSEDSIAETLSAQAEVLGKGVLGINFKKFQKEEMIRVDSPTYRLLHGEEDDTPRKQRPGRNDEGSNMPFQSDQAGENKVGGPCIPTPASFPPQSISSVTGPSAAAGSEIQPGENICFACQRLIIGVFVRIKGKNLHAECFKCATCGTSLKNVGYYNINQKLYCDIHAKQAAKQNPPAPNMVPVTVQPGQAVPVGAMTSPLARSAAPFQQPKAPAPAPAPVQSLFKPPVGGVKLPFTLSSPVPYKRAPAPAPVPKPAPVAPAPVVAPNFQTSANPQAFGAPAGGLSVRTHIPKKGSSFGWPPQRFVQEVTDESHPPAWAPMGGIPLVPKPQKPAGPTPSKPPLLPTPPPPKDYDVLAMKASATGQTVVTSTKSVSAKAQTVVTSTKSVSASPKPDASKQHTFTPMSNVPASSEALSLKSSTSRFRNPAPSYLILTNLKETSTSSMSTHSLSSTQQGGEMDQSSSTHATGSKSSSSGSMKRVPGRPISPPKYVSISDPMPVIRFESVPMPKFSEPKMSCPKTTPICAIPKTKINPVPGFKAVNAPALSQKTPSKNVKIAMPVLPSPAPVAPVIPIKPTPKPVVSLPPASAPAEIVAPKPVPSIPPTLADAAPVNFMQPKLAAPVVNFGGADTMPRPTALPGGFNKPGPGKDPIAGTRGVQAPGQRSAPRRGRGVMNQASGSRIPVCSNCQRQIRGPFVSALGKTWCPDHFICATETCRKPIIEMGFVEEQGRLYCEVCYESFLAPICGKCDKRVKGDCLNAVGKQFHPECFCCAYCGKVFGSGAFYLEDGLPYCETDWNDLFTTKCVGCSFPIEAGDRWVEALNSNYHSQCFKCSKCNKNLEGQSFFAKGGKPFCKAHAQRGF